MSMQQVPAHRRVIIGVDTHKYVHVAVALDDFGAILESRSFPADSGGYGQLLDWAAGLGGRLTFDDRRDRLLRRRTDQCGPTTRHRRHRGDAHRPTQPAVQARPTRSTPRPRPVPCWAAATAIPKSTDGPVEVIRAVESPKTRDQGPHLGDDQPQTGLVTPHPNCANTCNRCRRWRCQPLRRLRPGLHHHLDLLEVNLRGSPKMAGALRPDRPPRDPHHQLAAHAAPASQRHSRSAPTPRPSC